MTRIVDNEKLNKIKAIALDLDGTTLTREGLTRRTKETLEEAVKKGYKVVIATGRPYVALPKKVLEIKGLEHIIISNGAHVVNLNGNFLYSNYMGAKASLKVRKMLMNMDFPIEVFTKGQAFIDEKLYNELRDYGSTFMSAKYVLRTRTPVKDIYNFFEENHKEIENINIHFKDLEDRSRTWETFNQVQDITVTSSQKNNIELGGKTTNKATALMEFCRLNNIEMENVMSFGDSENDLKMLETTGFSCAMKNAVDVVKEISDYITLTNEEEGVCYAIRTLLFKENMKNKKNISSFRLGKFIKKFRR